MRIRWTPAAAVDLQRISHYLRERHPHYREATIRKVFAAIQSLKEWPHRGPVGREEGTRELLFPPLPYIAVYRVRMRASKSCAFITAPKTGDKLISDAGCKGLSMVRGHFRQPLCIRATTAQFASAMPMVAIRISDWPKST